MKIGQVVRRYNIPVNTLYFYINNGLLVPPRRSKQYIFDQHTLEELEWLLELKKLEFPLKTIHRLLSLRRISNFCSEEDQDELQAIFQEQAERLKGRGPRYPRPGSRWEENSSSWSGVPRPGPGPACRLPCCICCAVPIARES